jgi:hypothetical protein
MNKNKRVLFVLLFIDSLAVFAIWILNLSTGVFSKGLLAGQQDTSLPLLHLMSEFVMATTTLIGVIGSWIGKPWGMGITLFGLGIFTYSAINSLGWAFLNDSVQAISMGVTILIAFVGVPMFIGFREK